MIQCLFFVNFILLKILITGASGFIGRHLIKALLEQACDVVAVSRDLVSARKRFPDTVTIIDWENASLRAALETTDVVINLAGESIASRPWNKKQKTAIINSRLLAAQRLHQAMGTLKKKPALLLQASAIGYYGNRPLQECSELCKPGEGFLAEVCNKWEKQVPGFAEELERAVTIRIGVVLGEDGGVIPKLLKQSKRHMGGKIGSGEQWISWIHIYDLVYAIIYLMNDEKASGIYNMVAPEPMQQREFSKLIAESSGSKLQLAAPKFMIRWMLGEFGRELLLSGQKVSAGKLIRQGFLFKFITARQAIDDILDPYHK